MSEADATYPCPCCGYLMFAEPPGAPDNHICAICFWADCLSQLRFVTSIGANDVSLVDAQANYAAFGACEKSMEAHVRKPGPFERRDTLWRPFDVTHEAVEEEPPGGAYFLADDAFDPDPTAYYYWRKRDF